MEKIVVDIESMHLMADVYDHRGQFIYAIPLLNLTPKEQSLTAGRFRNYYRVMPGNKIFLRFDRNENDLVEYMQNIVKWIDEYARHLWSFEIKMLDVGRAELIFGFDDITEYFMFSMMFR